MNMTCFLKFQDINQVGDPVHGIAATSTTYAVVTTEKQVKVITGSLINHQIVYGCMFVFSASLIIIF